MVFTTAQPASRLPSTFAGSVFIAENRTSPGSVDTPGSARSTSKQVRPLWPGRSALRVTTSACVAESSVHDLVPSMTTYFQSNVAVHVVACGSSVPGSVSSTVHSWRPVSRAGSTALDCSGVANWRRMGPIRRTPSPASGGAMVPAAASSCSTTCCT